MFTELFIVSYCLLCQVELSIVLSLYNFAYKVNISYFWYNLHHSFFEILVASILNV